MLDRIDVRGVGFQGLDIADKSLDLGDGFFDVVTLSTILYQVSDQDRSLIQEIAKRYIKPEGVVIYQDFAVKDRDDPTRLHFHDTWFNDRFPYHTLVYDPHSPEELQDIFGWENGRCAKMITGLGRLALNNEKMTFAEYLVSMPH
jgi:SAM-dependent methyltransferase